MSVFLIQEFNFFDAKYRIREEKEIYQEFDSLAIHGRLPRCVYLLTINGRSIRQITRLLKAIYSDIHFYYIHVDQVTRKKKLRKDQISK
jgi:hypothetical protein